MDIFGFVGTWFGYVGACVVSPDATCRPFLAFLALGAAAATALTLVLLSYRKAVVNDVAEAENQHARAREREIQERVRRSLAEKAAIKPAMPGRLRHAA